MSVRNRLKEKKRVAVLGLGKTGLASSLFLKRRGYSVFVSESGDSETLEGRSARLRSEKIPFELGRHTVEKIAGCDWVLLSPGISPSTEIYQTLQQKRISRVSEIEVASWFSPGRVTAVTGTSGKTTVTTLLERIFQAHGWPSVSCGNIGNPWIGEVDRLTEESQVVLETSSFQLLHTETFRPDIGILLNLGRNHLDWHPTFEDYVRAKLRLFQSQTVQDLALVRRKDREELFPNHPFQARLVYYTDRQGADQNQQLLNEVTALRGLDPQKTEKVLKEFTGLEHRLERVGEAGGVRFVNDSKCTTLEALIWALEKFQDRSVILLAGGHAKGADFRTVRTWLGRKAKRAVVYGEARELLRANWEGAVPLSQASDLREAFWEAWKTASNGETVLLSPACASFDQFTNYQERGRRFKELVNEAKTKPVPT